MILSWSNVRLNEQLNWTGFACCRCLSISPEWRIYTYVHMYMYLDWLPVVQLPVDRLPVDGLPMEPPMDADRLHVGMVAFGSVACRTGCLCLGGMYNCSAIFHIHAYMHVHTHMCTCIYTYIHVYYVSTWRYVHACVHVQMYMWDLWNALESYRFLWNPQIPSVRVLCRDNCVFACGKSGNGLRG